MKNTTLSGLVTKFALAVATAASIGGGTAVIQATSTNAVQDTRLTQLEADRAEMHDLSKKLDETNRNVALLNQRLDLEIKR